MNSSLPSADPSFWHIRPQCFCHLSFSPLSLLILVFEGGAEAGGEANGGKLSLKTHHWPLIPALAWVCFSPRLKYSPWKMWRCCMKKKKRKKKKSVEKLPGMCVPEFAFPLKSLHDKLKFFSFFFFNPHSSLSRTQQVLAMKYLAEDKVFHVLLRTGRLRGALA